MSGFFIDLSEFEALRVSVGATQSQMVAAFNRALRRTVSKLYKQSTALMISELGVKSKGQVKRRVRQFTERLNSNSKNPGTGRIWFGLNDMPVSALKGGLRNPRGVRPQNRKRDEKGRFLPVRGSRGATFTPRGEALHATTFLNSFVGTVGGKRSIWIRNDSKKGLLTEAMLPVYHPMLRNIEGDIYAGSGELLLKYYEQDLRGRVAGGVK